jgi:hypothetical protein
MGESLRKLVLSRQACEGIPPTLTILFVSIIEHAFMRVLVFAIRDIDLCLGQRLSSIKLE